jgi:beta-mannosidase
MYTATFTLLNDKLAQNFGIKECVMDEDTQHWYLNGKKLFLRGMRYISSNWMSEANEKMWKEDLDKMLTFHINSIRIGSHVEKDGFYTMCDEMGFLLWQVFPLHYCVSDSDDFIERASEQIIEMGEMIYNHACLGMWSTFKEPEIYWFQDKPNNFWRLCEALKESLGTVDPTRWIHKGDYREGVQNIMIGLCQPGDTNLNDVTIQPIIVEFGAAAIPCLETLKTFIPEDKLWPPHWDTWEYWGLFYDRTFKFAKCELGNSLEEFIDNTQVYEAKVVKEQIEALRQRKYAPVGSMYLYYWSDPVAMIGSGVLDYYRRPYKVYDAMKAVYTPVLISLEWNADPYVIGRDKFYAPATDFIGKVWITNDLDTQSDCKIEWSIVKSCTNAVQIEKTFTTNLLADCAHIADHIVWNIPADAKGDYKVLMKVTGADGKTLSSNYTDIIVK